MMMITHENRWKENTHTSHTYTPRKWETEHDSMCEWQKSERKNRMNEWINQRQTNERSADRSTNAHAIWMYATVEFYYTSLSILLLHSIRFSAYSLFAIRYRANLQTIRFTSICVYVSKWWLLNSVSFGQYKVRFL